jgi:glycosyltransferase involved in cell wall biosynthesis
VTTGAPGSLGPAGPLAVAFAATVDPTEITGSGIATAHTAIALTRQPGVALTLVCPRPRRAPAIPGLEGVLAGARLLPGKPARGDVGWHVRAQLPMLRALRAWARRAPGGVLIARLAPAQVAPPIVARRRGIPYLLLVRGMRSPLLARRNAGWGRLAGWVTRLNARTADRAYAAFEEARTWIDGYRARDQVPAELLPNAVDPELFRPMPRDAARRALGLAPGAFVVGAVGSLNSRHALGPLVEAAARLRRSGPGDVEIVVVGDGPERPRLEALARVHGIAAAVRFAGLVPHAQVPAHVAACDALYGVVDPAAPSNPIKCYEYLACARPIVTTARPELEFVGREGVGVVVPALDPVAVAAGLDTLRALGDEKRREMGERGRRLVVEGHSWHAFAATLVRDARALAAPRRV